MYIISLGKTRTGMKRRVIMKVRVRMSRIITTGEMSSQVITNQITNNETTIVQAIINLIIGQNKTIVDPKENQDHRRIRHRKKNPAQVIRLPEEVLAQAILLQVRIQARLTVSRAVLLREATHQAKLPHQDLVVAAKGLKNSTSSASGRSI